MKPGDLEWFGIILTAGSILVGFCSTFLAFRIGREADYFRQNNQQHFTSAFFLIIVSTISSGVFGVVLPLLALIEVKCILDSPKFVVAGMIGSAILVAAYFVDELKHYGVLDKLDCCGWRNEWWIVVCGVVLSVIIFLLIWLVV